MQRKAVVGLVSLLILCFVLVATATTRPLHPALDARASAAFSQSTVPRAKAESSRTQPLYSVNIDPIAEFLR
jgi:hypothetical protein